MPSATVSKAASSVGTEQTETTPLLPRTPAEPKAWPKSVVYRVLATSFMVSLSFGVTQVPIIYVFGLMTCDEYYKTHASDGLINRCKLPVIESDTAKAVALMGASTTFFGVLNLFITGWMIKAFGIKSALVNSIFWPVVRLLIQNIGVEIGAGTGVLIMQLSQILTIIGGPAGYLLALNSMMTEVVVPFERTAALGRLQGCAMFGTSIGFLAGGLLGDQLDIKMPFRVAVILFAISTTWAALALPYIPLSADVEKKASKSLSTFFDPLKMFTPRKWKLRSGKVQREYGMLLLGIGIFLGVLATSYIPVLLQMYGTDEFGFGTTENGALICVNSLVRGIFLTFCFPLIIKYGRKWLDRRNETVATEQPTEDFANADEIAPAAAPDGIPPVAELPQPEKQESYAFDLFFTKYSLILDGIITGSATFISEPWQMYLLAVVLPLASGTGAAAKGTIIQMCTPEQRVDALGAISLMEMLASLTTTATFGLVFAAFAGIGKAYLTFPCNAAVATLGFLVLLFARFPPAGAERYEEPAEAEEDS